MKNQKGFSTLIFIIIIVVVVVGIIGLVNLVPIVMERTDITKLQCGTMSIQMPQDYMELDWPKNEILDNKGCFKDAPGGCTCLRTDKTSARSVFSTIEANKSELKIPPDTASVETKKQYLQELAQAIKSNPGSESILTDEIYGSFREYPSVTLSFKSNSNGKNSISKEIFFIRSSEVYNISFIASENSFNTYWPGIENSINNLTFTK